MASGCSFSSVLDSECYSNYLMSPDCEVIGSRRGGRGNQEWIFTYRDGTEWVVLLRKDAKERFCGFLYLESAIQEAGLRYVKAVANKMAIEQGRVVYLSQYCGEDRPSLFSLGLSESQELVTLQKEICFTDMGGMANVRQQGEDIYVFDTAKNSFNPSVHEKIDAFVQKHDAICALLESARASSSH